MTPNTLKTVTHYNLSYAFRRGNVYVGTLLEQKVPHHLAKTEYASYLNRRLELFWSMYMPRKTKAQNNAYNITWKRVDLTPEEKGEFAGWLKKGEFDLGELLTHVLNSGDRVTIKYSDKDDYYYCTVMGTDESHLNTGLGFSSFAKDPLDALLVSLYKYSVLLQGDLNQGDTQGERGDFG